MIRRLLSTGSRLGFGLALVATLALAPISVPAQESSLPPDVRFDILRLELEAAARAGRHKEVLVIADKIRKTGLDAPTNMSFLEARAFHALGAGVMARRALVSYLKTNGRSAKNYDEAIKLFVEIKRVQREKDENAKARAALVQETELVRTAMRRAREHHEAWKKLAIVFGGPGDDSALALAHGVDGNLVVAGALHARKEDKGKTVNTTLPWITAFDAKGPRAWHRPLGSAEDAGSLRSIVAIPGRGFLLGGAQKGFQFAAVSDPLGNLIYNEDGDPWVIGFAPATGNDAGGIARLLPSGDIIAVGAADIGADRETGKALARLPIMVRLSPTGKVRAKAVLGDTKVPTWHRLHDAIVIDGADLIVAGEARRNGEHEAGAYLMRIDAEGKNVWTRSLAPSGTGTLAVNTVASLPGGGVLAAGHDGRSLMVLAISGAGEVLWRKIVPTTTSGTTSYPRLCDSDAKKIGVEITDQDFKALRAFACGAQETMESAADSIAMAGDHFIIVGHDGKTGSAGGRITLTAIDTDGTIAWQSTQGAGTDTRAHAAIATADGGIVIAGTTEGWGRDVALFKVDAKGDLVRFAALAPRQKPPMLRPGRKPEPPPVAKESNSEIKEPAKETETETETEAAEPEPAAEKTTPEKTAESPTPTSGEAEYSLGELLNGLFKATPDEKPKSVR